MNAHAHAQRKTATGPASASRPSAPVPDAGRLSGGQALDRRTNAEMSVKFGHDFSSVRIHTDARAEDSAHALGAHAYAVGSDIVFGAGKYVPGSPETERLLAHELTHVAQQAQFGVAPGGGTLSRRGDAAEREADALGEQAQMGRPVQVQAAPTAAVHLYQPPQAGDDEWSHKTQGDGLDALLRGVEAIPGVGNLASAGAAAVTAGVAGYDALTGHSARASRELKGAEDLGLNAIPILGNLRAGSQAWHDAGVVNKDFDGVSPEENQSSFKQAPVQMDRLNSGLGEVFGGLFGTEEAQTVPTTGGA